MRTGKINRLISGVITSLGCLLFFCAKTYAAPIFTITPSLNQIKVATTGSSLLSFEVKNTSGIAQTIENIELPLSLGALFHASTTSQSNCIGQRLSNDNTCTVKVFIEGKGLSGNSKLDLVACSHQGAVCSKLAEKVNVETKVLTCSEAGGKVIDGATACWILSVIDHEPFHCSNACASFGKNMQSPGPVNSQTLAENVIHAFNSHNLVYIDQIDGPDVFTAILDAVFFKDNYIGTWSSETNTDWDNPTNIITERTGSDIHCPCEPDA